MPGLSGFDLAAKIAADRPGTRILIMSGYAYGTYIAKTAGQIGHGFIEKPFTSAALLAKVREVLDAR
jgi:YesN/AraC family two-component response regulator